MNETTTPIAATESAAASAKKVAAKKSATAAASVKKPVTKAAPAAKKSEVKFDADGRRITLRDPQILLLKALKGAKNGCLSRTALSEKCPGVGLSEHLGTLEGTKNKYTVSLTEQKMTRQDAMESDKGGTVVMVTITKTGLAALAKLD